ncbi:MAG: HEAT repeat domain-containing protein [Planctomycetes bacterium]|nr:HEAT repeat domain-containing protein [Planctomycetota bacterium]
MLSAWILISAFGLSSFGDGAQIAPPVEPSATLAAESQPTDEPTAAPAKSTAQELDDFLLLITGNNTPEARELGARNLLRIGTDEAARRLSDVLKAPNDALAKQAVCRAMLSVDRPHRSLLEPLLSLLGRNPPELAQMIPATLRRFESPTVIPRLRAMASDTVLPLEQRNAVIAALGFLGDDLNAVSALIEILQDSTDALRASALEAAWMAGTRFLDAVAARAWWEAHDEMDPIEWLRDVNQRRKDEIQRMRADRETLVSRLVAAYREAYLLTPEAEQSKKLLAYLRDDSGAVRGLALDLINGLITDRKAINQEVRAQLLKLVTDPNPVIRRRTAGIVGDLRPAGSGERLTNALTVELDPTVRAAQVAALGRLDDAAVIPALLPRLDDPSRLVVGEAASSIGLLARRGGSANGETQNVISAMIERYAKLSSGEDDVRERFIEAMGRIGADEFRPIFIDEMAPSRGVRVRSAAITAFSSYVGSAEHIRKSATAQEPEVRLAVVQALGRCGRGREDLDALGFCLDSAQEPNQSVREKAWESYMAVVKRLPARDQVEMAERFNRPNDAASQRRRADLLFSLKNSNDRTEPLAPAQRLSLVENLASAQSALHDYASEAKSLEEAISLALELKSEHAEDLRIRLVEALLHDGQDVAAMAQLKDFAPIESSNSGYHDRLADTVVREIEARLGGADLAAEFARLMDLIRIAAPVIAQVSPDYSARLADLKLAAETARLSVVNRHLDAVGTDSESEARILSFGREVVLVEIAARLSRKRRNDPARKRRHG